jgi:hypothetical protein
MGEAANPLPPVSDPAPDDLVELDLLHRPQDPLGEGELHWRVEPDAVASLRARAEGGIGSRPIMAALWITDLHAGRDTLVFSPELQERRRPGVGLCRVSPDTLFTDILVSGCALEDHPWDLSGDVLISGRDLRGPWAGLVHPVGDHSTAIPDLAAGYPCRAASGEPTPLGSEEFDPLSVRGVLRVGQRGLALFTDLDGVARGWLFADRPSSLLRRRVLASRQTPGRMAIVGGGPVGVWRSGIRYVRLSSEGIEAALRVIRPSAVSRRLAMM